MNLQPIKIELNGYRLKMFPKYGFKAILKNAFRVHVTCQFPLLASTCDILRYMHFDKIADMPKYHNLQKIKTTR